MPGYSDGYGLDAERFYDHEAYIKAVGAKRRRVKRGGRPILNDDQQFVIDEYIPMVQVTRRQFEAGTGFKQLFDLQSKCITSSDTEHFNHLIFE